jgi:hypothetical protein
MSGETMSVSPALLWRLRVLYLTWQALSEVMVAFQPPCLCQDFGAGRWAKPRHKVGEHLANIGWWGTVIDINGRVAWCTKPIRQQTPHFERYVWAFWASTLPLSSGLNFGEPAKAAFSSPSFLLRLFQCYQARLKLRQFEHLCENFDKPGYLTRFSRR